MPIIHIDVDSLRPDHVGAYGYENGATPNIDEFAADAVRFENAYTANSPYMPSGAAMLTARYGIHNGVASRPAGSNCELAAPLERGRVGKTRSRRSNATR